MSRIKRTPLFVLFLVSFIFQGCSANFPPPLLSMPELELKVSQPEDKNTVYIKIKSLSNETHKKLLKDALTIAFEDSGYKIVKRAENAEIKFTIKFEKIFEIIPNSLIKERILEITKNNTTDGPEDEKKNNNLKIISDLINAEKVYELTILLTITDKRLNENQTQSMTIACFAKGGLTFIMDDKTRKTLIQNIKSAIIDTLP